MLDVQTVETKNWPLHHKPNNDVRSNTDRRPALADAPTRTVEAKEHVFWEGAPKSHVYRIEEGVIVLYKLLSDGRRQVIDFAYPGDLIGLETKKDHCFSAQAACRAKVRCIPTGTLRRSAAQDPALALELFSATAQTLDNARRLLVSIGQGTAMERISTFLLSLLRRTERADLQGDSCLHLPMRRMEIADLLGLTIETVSRTLTKLRTMRVIEIANKTEIFIRDLDQLENLAGL